MGMLMSKLPSASMTTAEEEAAAHATAVAHEVLFSPDLWSSYGRAWIAPASTH
jgi:hypothetical protein